ncbi:MAG: lysophospholipid acyltransferase family protein [Myxococcota bacterium]|nr:lysophospholipid acyltransferase family protein [Myxococcota bacterium]
MNPASLISTIVAVLLWILSGAVFLILGSLYLALSFIVKPRMIHQITRGVCRILLVCAGQRLVIRGRFPDVKSKAYIYVFNHNSMLDTFIMMAVLPEFTAAVGKKEQFSVPIWGAILRRFGAVPLDRRNREAAIASMDAIGRSFADGLSLLVSPEGTRSRTGELGTFKKGPFHLAVRHQVPVIPTVIHGAFNSKRKGDWRIFPNRIQIEVCPPISPEPREYGEAVEGIRHTVRGVFINRLERQRIASCRVS